MTMIYDSLPFVKLVQKYVVGNYEPIMRICGKIFIINLNNLQMLFMLWIKNKFSECLAPLHKHEGPQWKTFLATKYIFIWGQLPQIFFVRPNFVVLGKICFKQTIKIKILPP